jgi:hypothetical protein
MCRACLREAAITPAIGIPYTIANTPYDDRMSEKQWHDGTVPTITQGAHIKVAAIRLKVLQEPGFFTDCGLI